MNLHYLFIDIKRQLRNVSNTVFIIGIPLLMYLIFGSTQGASEEMAFHANVAFYVMVSMAIYGGVSAVVSITGTAALESMQGWSRQIGLTPMRNFGYVATKSIVAMLYSAIVITFIFTMGRLTGAYATSIGVWLTSAVLAWLLSSIFALYGLAVALNFKSDSAASVATGLIVVLSFFGNLFVPLSGTMLSVARFTPLYGIAQLARWPQLEGHVMNVAGGEFGQDSLAFVLLNVFVWSAIFAAFAVLGVRRGRRRT